MQNKSPAARFDGSRHDAAHARDVLFSISAAFAALNPDDVATAAQMIERALRDRRKVLLLGNGGSCATASHLATDLMLIAREARLRACITPLNDNSCLLSAMANDYGFAESGGALVEAAASSGDILLIFSCSGRSSNLVNAANTAARLGVGTLLIGSTLAPADFPADHCIRVQSEHYSAIETTHTAVAHLLVEILRRHFGVESSRCAPRLPKGSRRVDE